MSKKEFIIVLDLKDGALDYNASFDTIIDYLLKKTFKNEAIKISSRAIYCYADMPDVYPDATALIDDAFCNLIDIENNYDLDCLKEDYVVYIFKPDEEYMNHLKIKYSNEINYLQNRF